MRYIVAAVIAVFLTLSTASYGQGAYIHNWGTHSCGKYLAAVHGHRPGTGTRITNNRQGEQFFDDHFLYMAWLGGFLTAMNWFVMNEPNGIESDNAAVDVWIRKWCEQNPTKLLAEAAEAFVWDQRKEYLQGWFARQAR